MPKATVDKYDFLKTAEDDVGTSRQVFRMETVSAAESPADFADDDLRLGIARTNLRHVRTALALIVHHSETEFTEIGRITFVPSAPVSYRVAVGMKRTCRLATANLV